MYMAMKPLDEKSRLEELSSYGVLDTPAEEAFDRITRLAARLLGAPVALVSIIDESRQWVKSNYGLALREIPRERALCSHTILGEGLFIIPDTHDDERFKSSPLVTGDAGIRFYAGIPLKTPRGQMLGTLSVMDRVPRIGLSEGQQQILRDLAAITMDELELGLAMRQTQQHLEERQQLVDKIQAAYRYKSEFLTHVSHELRTPLNAIMGYTDLLLSKPHGPLGDPRYEEYISSVHMSGRHMLSLVTDILEYSKLRGGTSKLTLEKVNILDVLHASRQMFALLAEEKGVELIYPDLDQQPAFLEVDAVKFRQIMINLVSNAIKFTPRGGTVEVQVNMLPDMTRIVVRDNGVGIAPEDIDRVLMPFGQIHHKGMLPEGFGLGLPITKKLVERHGGTLEIVSQPGVGTEVQVLLPGKSGFFTS